jgi:hypothetical protein
MGIFPHPNRCLPPHPSDEILEDYAFSRLPEALAASVEEHLLVCHRCQDIVTATDEFAAALKSAVRERASQRSFLPPVVASRMNLSWGRMTLAAAIALAVVALPLVSKHASQEPREPVAVNLSSMRGPSTLAPAPAGKPLRFSIDVPDLVSTLSYRVQVVDAAGSLVWKGAVLVSEGEMVATMSQPLANGVYWVRLYGEHAELLREFGLAVN